MKVMVTGSAGLIGYYVAKRLLDRGDKVCGVDNINDYYDVTLKNAHLTKLREYQNFMFYTTDIVDREAQASVFEQNPVERVVNLAAQAGVRYSLKNPHAYVGSNLVGFMNILKGCRHNCVKHLVYASSSSVYCNNKKIPISIEHSVDHPVSFFCRHEESDGSYLQPSVRSAHDGPSLFYGVRFLGTT